MTNERKDQRWDCIWGNLARNGFADEIGGAEYRRCKSLWIIAGRPWEGVERFLNPQRPDFIEKETVWPPGL